MLPGCACQLLCHAGSAVFWISLCSLCVFCVSVVLYRWEITTEAQRTQRLHREAVQIRALLSCLKPVDITGFPQHLVDFTDVKFLFGDHPARVIFK
jgi:hypothetical protein